MRAPNPSDSVGFLRTQALSKVLLVFPETRIARIDCARAETDQTRTDPLPYLRSRVSNGRAIEIHFRREKHGRFDSAAVASAMVASGIADVLVDTIEVTTGPPLVPRQSVVRFESATTPEARSLPYVRELNESVWKALRVRSGVLDATALRWRDGRKWMVEVPSPSNARALFHGWGAGSWDQSARTVVVDGYRVAPPPFAIRSYEYVSAMGRRLAGVEDVA